MRVFRERLSFCLCPSFKFPVGLERGVWDLIVIAPDYCPTFCFMYRLEAMKRNFRN